MLTNVAGLCENRVRFWERYAADALLESEFVIVLVRVSDRYKCNVNSEVKNEKSG